MGILIELKYILLQDALLKLDYALIYSYLSNGRLAWGNTYPSYFVKLNGIAK